MSVSGTYDVNINTPMGAQKGRLVVEASGDRFSGNVGSDTLGSMDITDGTVAGDTISWTMDMKSPLPMTLDCKATVTGDTIAGTVKAGMFGTMDLSGTRVG